MGCCRDMSQRHVSGKLHDMKTHKKMWQRHIATTHPLKSISTGKGTCPCNMSLPPPLNTAEELHNRNVFLNTFLDVHSTVSIPLQVSLSTTNFLFMITVLLSMTLLHFFLYEDACYDFVLATCCSLSVISLRHNFVEKS